MPPARHPRELLYYVAMQDAPNDSSTGGLTLLSSPKSSFQARRIASPRATVLSNANEGH